MTAGMEQTRRVDQPVPCLMRIRIVRNGPWCCARIVLRLGMLCAEVNGEPADVDHLWTSGEFVDETTWERLRDDPPTSPELPLLVSLRGLMNAAREDDERLWFLRRPIRNE